MIELSDSEEEYLEKMISHWRKDADYYSEMVDKYLAKEKEAILFMKSCERELDRERSRPRQVEKDSHDDQEQEHPH